MKKPLIIISACQFTRLALMSLIPESRYNVRVYGNVTTALETSIKTSCGYLLADVPSLSSGEQVLLLCLLRLRNDVGQWQVCLTGDEEDFNFAPMKNLYNKFPWISTRWSAGRYQNHIVRWLLQPLPGDMHGIWLLTSRELDVLKILMQGMSFTIVARNEQKNSKTLHAIATRALMKLGLRAISDFRLLYTGCGERRVQRNIQLHSKYRDRQPVCYLPDYVNNTASDIVFY